MILIITLLVMCLTTSIKCAFKDAIQSGKIYKHRQQVLDPTPHQRPSACNIQDFTNFERLLTDTEWDDFQHHERLFRQGLDTKRLQDKQNFVLAGDPRKWARLFKILHGVFFKNGLFSIKRTDGREFGIPLLKYVIRILKTLPLDDNARKTPVENPAEWIERQLRFLRDVVQPSIAAATTPPKTPQKVSKNKLTYLWQHRRKKAIDVILNNCIFPTSPPESGNPEQVYDYYRQKCQSRPSTPSREQAPWNNDFNITATEPPPLTSAFSVEEIEKVILKLPNNKASGSDGVTYETLKSTRQMSCPTLRSIFNTCLLNGKVPCSWKGALIHRIPKKDNVPNDPSTWRDISLLPTVYKVFMKCLLSRILPWLVDTGTLSSKQKAYIERQGMNEHVFCLKTAIDDFKHDSAKLFVVFLDFRDAFGTLPHEVMLSSLEDIHLPKTYCDIVKDVYSNSYLQVICGKHLTPPVKLEVGIKTGCPWSAVNFIIAINQWLKRLCTHAPPHALSPNPVQGYADDVVMASRDEGVIKNMLTCTDSFLTWSGLQVKQSKCAVFWERRSGGNRWYRSKTDQPPSLTILGQPLRVYAKHENYTYLGHKFNIAGDWSQQVTTLVQQFTSRLDLIDTSPLPATLKVQAIRDIAFAKVQHLFANVHIPQKDLRTMDNKTVQVVRKWLCLNTHSTRCFIFQKKRDGGLGIPNCMWEYTAARQSHLINMLNCDDNSVRYLARASLMLDFKKRKVACAGSGEDSFLGFRRKNSGKLDTQAQGFGVSSDWPDLNDLCWRTGTELNWTSNHQPVGVTDAVVDDPSITVQARLHHNNINHLLLPSTSRQTLLTIQRERNMEYWSSLKLQGKLAKLTCADHSTSHAIFSNATISDEILIFCIKARLQVLPTKYNLSLWFPSIHSPLCMLHDPPQHLESVAHIMNSCPSYKGLYTARHDRLVDLIAAQIPCAPQEQLFKHTSVKPHWFNSPTDCFSGIPNTPDIICISQEEKIVRLFEVACAFDLFMEESFCTKKLKYHPLTSAIESCGYKCVLIVLVFGSLGHVHRLVVSGLNISGLSKRRSRQLAKYCSISAVIGSMFIWKRRCFLYP